MIRIGLVGCGYWGPNLIRNFSKFRECEVFAVADSDPRRIEAMARLYPKVKPFTSFQDLLNLAAIDAVVIATPPSTHYSFAKQALDSGKHVFVEKPMTDNVSHAGELVQTADRNKLVLMVDHTFIYTGAIQKMKELIRTGDLGEIYYYDSVRINLGLLQRDISVLWDLGPHDFSIMTYLLDKNPREISAVGARPVRWEGWELECFVYVTMRFDDGALAHFHLSWLSPVKIRRSLIGGSRKMLVYDQLDPDNQVKIFDKGVEILDKEERYQRLVQYRTGDMLAPKVDQTEALELVCRHFLDCVSRGIRPWSDGESGLQIVRLIDAAQRSLDNQGKVTTL